MSKRILILDDDPDFTGLMTDIFRQSNYETVPFMEPKAALHALQVEHFDMLVTDHRMPGMTGEVLVRELRKTHPGMPVVVVSGFLDNDTIRDLIRDGVGGIFLKPLNVANLLKRTATLLNEADAVGNRLPGPEESQRHKLPFRFESFPCISPASLEFANQLYAKRNFKGSLSLTTPPGTHFAEIMQDLSDFDMPEPTGFKLIPHGQLTPEGLTAEVAALTASGKAATLIVRNPDLVSAEKQHLIAALAAHKEPFENTVPVRFIFSFSHAVDELFERGRIQESLYLLASINEMRVPALAECPDDIPLLAARMLNKISEEVGIRPPLQLHKLAQLWIKEQPWPGNREELHLHLTRAADKAQSGLVTRESFARESGENQWIDSADGVTSLSNYLGRLRDDYIRAALILCDGDISLAAETLGVSQVMLATHPLARQPGNNVN